MLWYDMGVVDGYIFNLGMVKVSSDFNYVCFKLMWWWMFEGVEDFWNVFLEKGYIWVDKMN